MFLNRKKFIKSFQDNHFTAVFIFFMIIVIVLSYVTKLEINNVSVRADKINEEYEKVLAKELAFSVLHRIENADSLLFNNNKSIAENCKNVKSIVVSDYPLISSIYFIKDNTVVCGYEKHLSLYNKNYTFKTPKTSIRISIDRDFKGINENIFIGEKYRNINNALAVVAILFLISWLYFYFFTLLFKTKKYDVLTGMMPISDLNSSGLNIEKYRNAAVAIIDLDYFQNINENYGHHSGDIVIQTIASVILKWAGKANLCYRMNGEKFLILMCQKTEFDVIDEVDFLNKAIKHTLVKIKETGVEIHVSATIGISTKKNADFEEKRMLATLALKEQKLAKKGCIREKNSISTFENYNSGQELTSREIYVLWKDKKVFFEYQPIIIQKNNKNFVIYEALIRLWDQEVIYYPMSFLSKIKNSIVEDEMGKYVIQHHLELLLEKENVMFSLNINNNILLQEDIISILQDYWTEHGTSATSRLMLEVLEYDGISSYDDISSKINLIRQMGYKVAIDDFGSGYSNFSHILKMNVDYIKIDGEIIKHIIDNESSLAITKSIKFLSDQLMIPVIAEYVSNEAIFDKLKFIGINNVQGYHISKPQKLQILLPEKQFH